MRSLLMVVGLVGGGFLLALGASPGCGSSSAPGEVCDNNKDDDADGKTDCADSDCADQEVCTNATLDTGGTVSDASVEGVLVPDQNVVDAPVGTAAQQDVISELKLPTTTGEFGVDIDGTGPKNQLGSVLALLGTAGFDLQTELDGQLSSGNLLLLLELFGDSISSAADVTIQAHLGFDRDAVASDNFSGSEEFGISSNSPQNAVLAGSIASSKLVAGPGKLVVPAPLGGATPILLNIERAQVTADVSATGMQNGVIGGAIPKNEVDTVLLPAVAAMANDALANASIDQAIKDKILLVLDADVKDGTITVADIKASLIGGTLAPDVDINGNGTKDGLSVGLGFTAVTCVISRF